MSISSPRPSFKLVPVDDLDSGADAAQSDMMIGRVIAGRYTIQARIGSGGMADIYRAADAELGVDVAIKLLKPEIASREMRARMVQEARAAAQVRHPNLARVFGTGTLDNTAYIVMELLEGPNLEMVLRARPHERLPWRKALALLLPAMEALHAIHERGYVHRDIKPGNILVARESECPARAVVIDLGLARADRALRNVASPPTTEVGRVLCTPGYASPEQAAGGPVDRRSDVYSLAITLYRILAGRPPFHEARGKPLHVVFDHHIYNRPTRLVDAAVDADIPPEIAMVIESALAKDPAARPQTMLAFAEALRTAADACTPAPRSPFHSWPYAIVVAQLLVLILAWAMTPAPPSPFATALSSRPAEPQRSPDPSASTVETPSPSSEPPPSLDPPAPQPPAAPSIQPRRSIQHRDPSTVVRRELAGRSAAVQQCADRATSSGEQLAVAVNIDANGAVTTHAQGAADSLISRCLARVLDHTTIPPTRPQSFVHIYKLRTTPLP